MRHRWMRATVRGPVCQRLVERCPTIRSLGPLTHIHDSCEDGKARIVFPYEKYLLVVENSGRHLARWLRDRCSRIGALPSAAETRKIAIRVVALFAGLA